MKKRPSPLILVLVISGLVSAAGCGKEKSGGKIASRYADQEGVTIDPAKVPQELRDLIPLAKKWAIADDDERAALLRAAGNEEKKELVDKVWPRTQRIEQFSAQFKNEVPPPDEVVLFEMLLDTVEEAYPDVHPKN